MLYRLRLEKAPNAPFAKNSDTPEHRSAAQNTASASPSSRFQPSQSAPSPQPLAFQTWFNDKAHCVHRNMEQSTRTGGSKRQELAPC